MFIALRIPLGLETIMVLFIDVGTDLAPAVSLAYEEPEDAIMNNVPFYFKIRNLNNFFFFFKKPRTFKDHLITFKLMLVSYGWVGIL